MAQASTGVNLADDASRRSLRLNVHGHAADVRCTLPGVRQIIADVFSTLCVDGWPEGFHPAEGHIDLYDADVVARHMSSSADRVMHFGDDAELWRDGERCWLIDESWGVCEINLLKRSWRSWVLEQAASEPMRTLERAVLWPMSQLMVSRGMWLVPSASVVHRGRGILILSPFPLEPELSVCVSAGLSIIGQRWTAIREEDGRALLLDMPGRVERAPTPQLRSRPRPGDLHQPQSGRPAWVDLCEDPASRAAYAWCDAVMIIEPGRRPQANLKLLTGASAVASVKRGWPMPDIAPAPKQAQLAGRLGAGVQVAQVELSRDPRALLRMLEQIPAGVARLDASAKPEAFVRRSDIRAAG
jgi:hypothetical protein